MSDEKQKQKQEIDPASWTGDTSGGLAPAVAKVAQVGVESITEGHVQNALNEAKDVPGIMAVAGAAGVMTGLATVGDAAAQAVPGIALDVMIENSPVLPILLWAHVQRTKARLQADAPQGVEITNKRAAAEAWKLIKNEWAEAGLKSALEWEGRDANGDGVTSFGELCDAFRDIAGNYLHLPAKEGNRALLLDTAETLGSWTLLAAAGAAVKDAAPDLNSVEAAAIGYAIAVPTVAGVISVSKRDEKLFDDAGKTTVGAFLYDLLFDGKVGPGNDSYFDKLGEIIGRPDDPVDPMKPDVDRTIPAGAGTYSLGGEPENNLVLDADEMGALAAGRLRRQGGHVGKKLDLPGFVDAAKLDTVVGAAVAAGKRKLGFNPAGGGG